MKGPPGTMSLDEAVQWIMNSQKCSVKKARSLLMEAMQQGKVRTYGVAEGEPDRDGKQTLSRIRVTHPRGDA